MSGAERKDMIGDGRKPGMGVFLEFLTGMRRVGVGDVKPVRNQVPTYLGGNFESDRSSFTVIRGLSDMQYLRVFSASGEQILFFFGLRRRCPYFFLCRFIVAQSLHMYIIQICTIEKAAAI